LWWMIVAALWGRQCCLHCVSLTCSSRWAREKNARGASETAPRAGVG
jgi:hypothetical protein